MRFLHQERCIRFTEPALVRSYRRLMSIAYGVVRDTATMVRRIGQRMRTAPPPIERRLQRVQRRLRELRPIVDAC